MIRLMASITLAMVPDMKVSLIILINLMAMVCYIILMANFAILEVGRATLFMALEYCIIKTQSIIRDRQIIIILTIMIRIIGSIMRDNLTMTKNRALELCICKMAINLVVVLSKTLSKALGPSILHDKIVTLTESGFQMN